MLSKFVASYKHDFTHWHFYIPTIYGAGENPKRPIPYVINAIRNGEELHFTAVDQTRQYIHVNEVPRMLALAFEKNLPSGLYNIQGKGNCNRQRDCYRDPSCYGEGSSKRLFRKCPACRCGYEVFGT